MGHPSETPARQTTVMIISKEFKELLLIKQPCHLVWTCYVARGVSPSFH